MGRVLVMSLHMSRTAAHVVMEISILVRSQRVLWIWWIVEQVNFAPIRIRHVQGMATPVEPGVKAVGTARTFGDIVSRVLQSRPRSLVAMASAITVKTARPILSRVVFRVILRRESAE